MRYAKVTLIILLSMLIVVAGCSKDKSDPKTTDTAKSTKSTIECTIDADCTKFFSDAGTTLTPCDSVTCTSGKCGTTPKSGCCMENGECTTILQNLGLPIGKCDLPTCSNNACTLQKTTNCCGNNISESIEDTKKGSKCSCPEDWGTCDPIIKFLYADGTIAESRYLKRQCTAGYDCQVSYVAELQKGNEIFNTMQGPGFSFNIYVRYRTPFDKDNSGFDIEIRLTDMDIETQVQEPVVVTELRIMDGSNILVRSESDLEFEEVDDKVVQTLVLSDYSIVYPEELKDIVLSIDYEYTPLIWDGVDYTPAAKPSRSRYDVHINQIPFLDKTLVK